MTTSTTIVATYYMTTLAPKVFVLKEEDNGHTPLRVEVQQQYHKPRVKDHEILGSV
jgi:hypothetical protein